MDSQLFFLVQKFSRESPLVDAVGIFFAVNAIFLLAALAAGFLIADGMKRQNNTFFKTACSVVVAVFAALLINASIGALYFRERPFVAYGFTPLVAEARTSKSFPSDHTASAFAIATLFSTVRPRFGAWFFLLAFLIGLARVFAGIHYPSDILAGAGVGMLAAVISYYLLSRYVHR